MLSGKTMPDFVVVTRVGNFREQFVTTGASIEASIEFGDLAYDSLTEHYGVLADHLYIDREGTSRLMWRGDGFTIAEFTGNPGRLAAPVAPPPRAPEPVELPEPMVEDREDRDYIYTHYWLSILGQSPFRIERNVFEAILSLGRIRLVQGVSAENANAMDYYKVRRGVIIFDNPDERNNRSCDLVEGTNFWAAPIRLDPPAGLEIQVRTLERACETAHLTPLQRALIRTIVTTMAGRPLEIGPGGAA